MELDSLANIDYGQGGCDKALPTYQHVLEIDPDDPHAYAVVRKCLFQGTRWRQGIAPSTRPIPAREIQSSAASRCNRPM